MWLEESEEADWLSYIFFCTERFNCINTWNCYPSAVLISQIKMLTNTHTTGLDLCVNIVEWDTWLPGAFQCGIMVDGQKLTPSEGAGALGSGT